MKTQFALDLRTARKKAGYTQGDVAHLLDCHQSLVSELERGKQRPRLEQIVDLSLIYGGSFESLFAEVMAERRAHLPISSKTCRNRSRQLPKPLIVTDRSRACFIDHRQSTAI
ncbi:MAG: helix-turn-helix transcriptional regulator [Pseudomonadota bacterium]